MANDAKELVHRLRTGSCGLKRGRHGENSFTDSEPAGAFRRERETARNNLMSSVLERDDTSV